jgi:glycosyltransferase involved in cell wall biosynthesis
LGKGEALRSGFKEALNKNYDIIITIDADLQHDPSFIPLLLNNIENFDIVIGNRLHDIKAMPFQRIISNKITSYMLSKKLKTDIRDSQCGYRAYKSSVLNAVKTSMKGFEAESEILVLAARHNFSIGFIDIPTIYGNDKSKMKSLQAIKGFIKVMMS